MSSIFVVGIMYTVSMVVMWLGCGIGAELGRHGFVHITSMPPSVAPL